MVPIGFVHTDAKRIPRHWTVSAVEGTLVVDERYTKGLKDIKPRQRIVVIFHFHQSPDFAASYLTQTPPHRKKPLAGIGIGFHVGDKKLVGPDLDHRLLIIHG